MRVEDSHPFAAADSLPRLMIYDNLDFVRGAYATILGRAPDSEGEAYYLERLRSGHSKLEILWQLRKSAEGRRRNSKIPGLDRELRKAAWSRKRFIGWFVRLFTGTEADDRLGRMQNALLNELAAVRSSIDEQGGFIRSTGFTQAISRIDFQPIKTPAVTDLSALARQSFDILISKKSQ